jgi:DNA mismatch endonuclease (patch repair protein)
MKADRGQMGTTPEVRLRMSRQRSRDTSIEIALRQELHKAGLRYRLHRRPVPSLRREADLLFGPARVAVMVDGCFWHGCPDHIRWPSNNWEYWRDKIEGNRRRDRATDDALASAGWVSLRVWEHERPDEAAARVAAVVGQRVAAAGASRRGRSTTNGKQHGG